MAAVRRLEGSEDGIGGEVSVLLGGGTPFFQTLPAKVQLRRLAILEAPGVTHVTFSVLR